ncbi:MAG: putative phosphatidyltransferase [Chloroflexi bacterium]|jgi:phosphatidylglycerophosphate synthase|nr:putative phosphatidyltransferase [Chloroflexota bacterium]
MPDIKSHKRVNDILLGPLERPALRWMAAHTPAWITPDIMTGIGVIGGIIILLGYLGTNQSPYFLWLASFGFVVNWVGDSLDGTLARHRKIERPRYGFFIDHTVDALIEVMVFLGLGLSPYVSFNIACLALIGYLLVSVLVYVRTCVAGVFVISYGKLGPTEARLIAILANTLIFFVGNPQLSLQIAGNTITYTVYDWLAIAIIILLWSIYILSTIRQARVLSREDIVARNRAATSEEAATIQ